MRNCEKPLAHYNSASIGHAQSRVSPPSQRLIGRHRGGDGTTEYGAAAPYKSFRLNTRTASSIGTIDHISSTTTANAIPQPVPRNSRNKAPV